MRATLDSLGVAGRTVWVADSFGLPRCLTNRDAEASTWFDFLAVPLDEVRANFARFGFERGVSLVPRVLRGHDGRA